MWHRGRMLRSSIPKLKLSSGCGGNCVLPVAGMSANKVIGWIYTSDGHKIGRTRIRQAHMYGGTNKGSSH